MAKKKKTTRTLTMLTDVDDAILGMPNSMPLGPEGTAAQFIEIKTVTPWGCSVCGMGSTLFWTVGRPFATTEGGDSLPPFALVCHHHGPCRIERADNYVAPEPVVPVDYGAEDRCIADPGCGTAMLCSDKFHRCPEHAAKAGFCGVCGVRAENGICTDCEALNNDLDNTETRTVACESCSNNVDVTGPVTTDTICSVCGQPMVAS